MSSVFLLGVTGYIGGSIFQALLDLPTPPARITCLVRDRQKGDQILELDKPKSTSFQVVIGSLSDSRDAGSIAQAAEEHDVVINAATADQHDWLKPIFAGIRKRKEKSGKVGIFIHTSGTGMFHDRAMGMYEGDKVCCLSTISPT